MTRTGINPMSSLPAYAGEGATHVSGKEQRW